MLFTVLVLLAVATTSGVVAASPFLLRRLGGPVDDWERLSFIGQTYGAASALLSVLALIGVAVSLVLQARESKAAREQALRELHTDLLKMAMDDPLYRRAWGPFYESEDSDRQREHIYINLIVQHWQMMYALRAITEEHLRSAAHIVFSGQAGQRYWQTGRELRAAAAGSRQEKRFHQILDEEYLHALEAPAAPPPPVDPVAEPNQSYPRAKKAAAAGAAAVLILLMARRLMRRR